MMVKDGNQKEKYRRFILGNNSPCRDCIVRGTCGFSFIQGTACEKLAIYIVGKVEDEARNSTQNRKDKKSKK